MHRNMIRIGHKLNKEDADKRSRDSENKSQSNKEQQKRNDKKKNYGEIGFTLIRKVDKIR